MLDPQMKTLKGFRTSRYDVLMQTDCCPNVNKCDVIIGLSGQRAEAERAVGAVQLQTNGAERYSHFAAFC